MTSLCLCDASVLLLLCHFVECRCPLCHGTPPSPCCGQFWGWVIVVSSLISFHQLIVLIIIIAFILSHCCLSSQRRAPPPSQTRPKTGDELGLVILLLRHRWRQQDLILHVASIDTPVLFPLKVFFWWGTAFFMPDLKRDENIKVFILVSLFSTLQVWSILTITVTISTWWSSRRQGDKEDNRHDTNKTCQSLSLSLLFSYVNINIFLLFYRTPIELVIIFTRNLHLGKGNSN